MSEEENEFNGYDWTELSVEWGIIDNNEEYLYDEEDEIRKETKEKMLNALGAEPDEQIVNDCAEYIRAMLEYEAIDYYSPLWKALLEIRDEDENSFLKAFASLLGHAWT